MMPTFIVNTPVIIIKKRENDTASRFCNYGEKEISGNL